MTNDRYKNGNGSRIILTNNKSYIEQDSNLPYFITEDFNIPDIAINSILLLESNGTASVIYDSSSVTNSLFVTEKCNSRCLSCPQPPKRKDIIDWISISKECINLIDNDKACIGITGGEPTCVFNSLIEIVEQCRHKIPNTTIQLLSNGRIFANFEKAKKVSDAADNNLFIGIPLYSDAEDVHDEMVGVKGAFWETIEGIYNLELLNIPIELRILVTKMNYGRLKEMSEWVYRNMPFVEHVAFMGIEPIGDAAKNIEKLWIDPVDSLPQIEKAIRMLSQRNILPLLFNFQLCTLPDYLWKISKRSISEWKITFFDECDECSQKRNCGGFFFSSEKYRSRGIHRLKN